MNFLNSVVTIFSALFGAVQRLATKYGVVPIGTFLIAMWGTILMNILLMSIFWAAKFKAAVIIFGIASGILFLGGFNTGKLYAAVITWIGRTIFRLKVTSCEAYDELLSLIKPALFVSLANAFLACIAAIKGVQSLSLETMLLWSAVFLFFFILSYYPGRTIARPEYIMAVIVVVLLMTHIIAPVQSRAPINFVERWTIGQANNVNMTGRDDNLIFLRKGTLYFSYKDGQVAYQDSVKQDTKAKILNTVDDEFSGDQYYELLLPVKDGYYNSEGTKIYVPQRVVDKIEDVKPVEQKEVKQVSEQKPAYQKGQILEEWVEFPAHGEVRIPVDMERGDKVEYCFQTATFETKGAVQWWKITNYDVHECTNTNHGTLRGCGTKGKVLVRVTKYYYL